MVLTRTRLDRWIAEHDVQLTPEAIGDLMAITDEPGCMDLPGQLVPTLVRACRVLALYDAARQEPGSLAAWRFARRQVLDSITQFADLNDRDVHGQAQQA